MTWADRLNSIRPGDTVRFSHQALKSIFTNEPIHVSPEGIVTGIEERDGYRFALVDWGEPNIPDLVNVLNLRKVTQREVE